MKINFQRGSIVEPNFLNRIQEPIRFVQDNREDYYGDTDGLSWPINYRDGLKDWEIDDRRMGGLSRIAHDGRVLGHNNNEIVYGPAQSSLYGLDISTGLINMDDEAPSGSKYVYIESGSVQDKDGNIKSWPRVAVLLPHSNDYYLYFDPRTESPGYTVGEAPTSSQGFILLARVSLDSGGQITEYIDLRGGAVIGSIYNYSLQLLNSTEVYTTNSTLNSWERAFVDTSDGSIILFPPENPQDGDHFAILDIAGKFKENPLILRPGEEALHNTVEDWVFTQSGAYIEMYYVEQFSSWFFKNQAFNEECEYIRGGFISCGGNMFSSVTPESMCPNGQSLPEDERYGISLGIYSFDNSSSKCYHIIDPHHAVYSNGENDFFYEPWALKCGSTKAQYKQWLNS